MLWIERRPKRTMDANVVRLDPPLHGANVNDAPACGHGKRMASIKPDADSPSGLSLRYWSCHCVVPLVGAEHFRYVRQMREAVQRQEAQDRARGVPLPTCPLGAA